MPLYTFVNEDTGEVRDIFFHMTDEKDYRGENGNEASWKRVWHSPRPSVKSNPDYFSKADFLEKTNKAGTIGDLWDRSQEWSEKRKEIAGGEDPVAKQFFDDYSKTRRGLKHMKDPNTKFIPAKLRK